MRAIHIIALLPVITVLCCGQEEGAPKNELAFGLGGLPSLSRSDAPSLNAGPGKGLRVNYGRRFLDANKLALCGEINFLASPLREVSSSVTSDTQNFASLYVTPGVRLKVFPKSRISPYLAIGGLTQCLSGRGEQAGFPDMNREGTALGLDGLFRLIGTGEDKHRRGRCES